MKNYKLHYASLNSKGNIPCYSFETFNELVSFIYEKIDEYKEKRVYLIAKDFQTRCPIVTDDKTEIGLILNKLSSFGHKSDTFIQEYNSFEEAYKVALTICEKSELCYS